jgi:hypothetical protein
MHPEYLDVISLEHQNRIKVTNNAARSLLPPAILAMAEGTQFLQ